MQQLRKNTSLTVTGLDILLTTNQIMVSLSTPSTGAMITFALSVLVIGLGVAFAPEIKSAVLGIKRKAIK